MRTDGRAPGARVLVGAVAQLYQGDLDFGRVALERLAADELGRHVLTEDLSYGAVAVSQRLAELEPLALVLVGAAARGRPPGTLERRRVRRAGLSRDEVQQAVAEAVTGYVGIDLVVEVAEGLGTLPEPTVAIELEPATTDISDRLSAQAEAALDPALMLVRAEVRGWERSPLSSQRGVSKRAEPGFPAPPTGR